MQFKSYNLFEEMMELELTQKRCDFIQSLKDSMVDMDKEGNEIKFFSSKFLVQKYLKFSDADLKLNDKMKQEEIEELNLAGGESEDEMMDDMQSLESERANLLEKLVNIESKIKKKKEVKKKDSKEDSEEE
jgi:hypothetical protein